jgi:hypothetical protein
MRAARHPNLKLWSGVAEASCADARRVPFARMPSAAVWHRAREQERAQIVEVLRPIRETVTRSGMCRDRQVEWHPDSEPAAVSA